MAHFAKLNENNIVTGVVVVDNSILLQDGVEVEELGKQFLQTLYGDSTWVQTSYNDNIRKQYAGIGMTYNNTDDVFIITQPYESWTLDENYDWHPPVAYPSDNRTYTWNEADQTWDAIIPPQLFDSWQWNESEWVWESPVEYPDDDQIYTWNEETTSWNLITE
jgi:hypothetical protein